MRGTASRLLKYLLWVSATLFVLGMVAIFYLSAGITNEPTVPMPDLGKTVPWNNHGDIHYVSEQESRVFFRTFWTVVGLFLCVATIVGFQDYVGKWTGVTGDRGTTRARKLFRLGPGSLTVLMLLWTVAVYPIWGHYDSWAARPIFYSLPIIFFWHMLLIAMERAKLDYVVYTIGNIGLYVILGFWCLHLITGDSL